MKTNRFTLAAILVVLFLSLRHTPAADGNPPERMAYQGFLVDGNGSALGLGGPKNYDVVFRVFNEQTEGARLWTEQQTITVDKGYFSVLLGEGSEFSGEPRPPISCLFTNADASDRYIEITVRRIGDNGTDATIAPRLRLVTSPYSFLAQNAIYAANLVNSAKTPVVTVSGGNVGINKGNANEALDVNGTVVATTVKAGTFVGDGTIPIGGIIMWSGSEAEVPSGWALCNGTTNNSRVTPDLRGRFILGSGTGLGLTARAVGQKSGEEKHTLAVEEMPSHSHGTTLAFTPGDDGWGGPYEVYQPGGDGIKTTAVGGGLAHNNMPPFYVLAFIMRVR
jgi:microcystin-dependent protein